MSTRTLTSIPTPNPSLTRSRYPIRLVGFRAVGSSHISSFNSVQSRMLWGRGLKCSWYHNHHSRVDRRDILHDLLKDYRGKYVLMRRKENRRSGKRQFWKDWNDSLNQSRREQDDTGRDSKSHRYYWDVDMSELMKRIEKDPYDFLFGRSNEYLKMGKGWSTFCRSFLDPKSHSEQKETMSGAQEHTAKSTTANASPKTPTREADGGILTVKPYKTSDTNDLCYDPISGRMKPVEQQSTEVIRGETKDDNHDIDIPAKNSNGVKSGHIEASGQESLRAKDTVPAQTPRPPGDKQSIFYMAGPTDDSPMTLKDTSSTPNQGLQQYNDEPKMQQRKKKLHYEPDVVTEDDVDLLRASDIRASFFAGETKHELAEKKKKTRESMEKGYSLAIAQNIDDEILQGLRQKKEARAVNETAFDNEIPEDATNTPQAEKQDAVYQADSNTVLESNAFATTSALTKSLDVLLQDTRRFIDNVQLITNDVQDACLRLEASTNFSKDALRILAFDSVNSQVVCAETTSSIHTNGPIRHAAEVLLHLNNPAKFLPYFAKMKADGYEIVSGGGDILIFRKTGLNDSESAIAGSAEVGHLPVPVDSRIGSTTDPLVTTKGSLPLQPSAKPDRSKSRIVQRQETVFTGGPPNWSPYESTSSSSSPDEALDYAQTETPTKRSTASKLGKGIRRIVLSGVATAGTFYAIGVVCEYFLTGGQEGLGPEGFSEFEAERRRRE